MSGFTSVVLRVLGDGCRGRCRGDVLDDSDLLLVPADMLELDAAGDRREDGEVAAEACAGSGEERHATLADDDRAGADQLAVAPLHAQALANAVAAVLGAGACLLVGHGATRPSRWRRWRRPRRHPP